MSEEQKQNVLNELKGYTCTSLFLVPLLKIGTPGVTLQEQGFINGYLDDVDAPVKRENCLYLLFKPKNFAHFAIFFAEQSNKNPLLVDDYDVADGYVVLVYEIPKKFLEDFKLFLDGKYSKLSEDFQETHPKKGTRRNAYGKIEEFTPFSRQVFNKDRELKAKIEEVVGQDLPEDIEVWGIPDRDKETLNIKNFL